MLTIDFLADHLDTIATLVKCFREQWPAYYAGRSDAQMERDFRAEAARDRLPSRLVAFQSRQFAGTIVLRQQAHESLAAFQPELGGLYVPEHLRGQGIGTALVRAGMQLALNQGYQTVYATTKAAVDILIHLGWEFVQTVEYQDGQFELYRCKRCISPTPMAGRSTVSTPHDNSD
jgi:N-acetylglutamate synthase-like GNAT family acetyltransferase